MSYASGRNAYGISDRSGRRYRLREMKTEWTGAKVGPDEFETKHPQLFPPRAFPDPQALRGPRPETELPEQRAIQHGYNPVGFRDIPGVTPPNNLVAQGEVGTVTITISDTGNEAVNVTGSAGTSAIGSVAVNTTSANVSVSLTGLAGTGTVGSIPNVISDTFAVTVANPGSGNRYYIDTVLQATLNLNEGRTYIFNWSSATSHPLRFSTTSDGTHGGGSEYTTGVVKDDSAYTTQITVAASAPTLYYYCQYHSGMGGQINTP
jgi:plastocyanin